MKNINLKAIRKFRGLHNSEPAYDVNQIGISDGANRFILQGFDDSGVDYYDAVTGRYVQSIGRNTATNAIIASFGTEFYPSTPEFECIWLR